LDNRAWVLYNLDMANAGKFESSSRLVVSQGGKEFDGGNHHTGSPVWQAWKKKIWVLCILVVLDADFEQGTHSSKVAKV
jgi:hypothetical protein